MFGFKIVRQKNALETYLKLSELLEHINQNMVMMDSEGKSEPGYDSEEVTKRWAEHHELVRDLYKKFRKCY